MSRIEKALEKALELRESQKREAPVETTARDTAALPKFEADVAVVDKDRVDLHLVCISDPYSAAAEQYKKLRARVLMATKKEFLNTIMVTSSNMGEGKTVTSINLAVAIANAYDNTVLLVDADLRNPSVCRYLGIEPRYGLTDCLEGRAKISEAIIKTGIGRLAVLPAGTPPANPAEVLSSERMKRLVQELKARYKDRYVIFDSSPVLATADAISLGGYVDGTLLVVQALKTSEKALTQAVSLLKGYNILGMVLNNMPSNLTASSYPYYGHYGQAAGEKNAS